MKSRSEVKAARDAVKEEPKQETVEEISKKLEKELHTSTKPDPFQFESVNKPKKSKLRPDMQKIVETVFVTELHEMWKTLREELTIGEKRSDHGTLQKALDQAERNAHNAHRLFVTAKVEMERWERENDVTFGAMWSEANDSIQHEKNSGARSKQVTDADIRMRIATLHPDEYSAQETERSKVKQTVASLENLAAIWGSRCHSLNSMLNKLRG